MKADFRVSWGFGTLGTLLLVLKVLDRYSPKPEPTPDPLILATWSCLALLVAALMARDIWTLKVRRFPLWFDLLVYLIGLGGLAWFIYLKETTHPSLSMGHVDVPAMLIMFPVAAVAAFTEKKKGVRVYQGLRTLIFKPA